MATDTVDFSIAWAISSLACHLSQSFCNSPSNARPVVDSIATGGTDLARIDLDTDNIGGCPSTSVTIGK